MPASLVAGPSVVTFPSLPPPPDSTDASGAEPPPPESKSPRSDVQCAVPRATASAAAIRSARPVETETGIISLIQGTRPGLATDRESSGRAHGPTRRQREPDPPHIGLMAGVGANPGTRTGGAG